MQTVRIPNFIAQRFGLGSEARSLENPSTDLYDALTLGYPSGYGLGNSSGVTVTPDNAMTFAAVYAAIRVISETVGSLPFHLYRQDGQSRIMVENDPRAYMLNEEPNPEMSAMVLWEMVLGHLNLWGNAYLFKTINPGTGLTEQLWPLLPSRTRPVRLPDNSIAYVTYLDNGEERILVADQVIHIRAFGTGQGHVGISPIGAARQAIGIGIAADEYAGRFFSNDAKPGGILKTDKVMSQQQYEDFRRRWDAGHRGLNNSHLLGILDNGMEWQNVGLPPGDAQFIENRKWQKREVATAFRVPPHKIGDAEPGSVSYASVEMFSIEFVTDTVRPWCTRLEQAVRRGVFSSEPDRLAGLYPKFQINGLLRGDMAARSAFYKDGIESGWLLPNEVREFEDLPYVEGLDEKVTDPEPVNPNPVPEGEPQTPIEGRNMPDIHVHVPDIAPPVINVIESTDDE